MQSDHQDIVRAYFKKHLFERDPKHQPPGTLAHRLFDYQFECLLNHNKLNEAAVCQKLKNLKTHGEAIDALTKGDNTARKAAGTLRPLLQAFERSPLGKRLPGRFEFPSSNWNLQFKTADSNIKSFWYPYLEILKLDKEQQPDGQDQETVIAGLSETLNNSAVHIFYTENVFFRHIARRVFIRHMDLNEEDDDIRKEWPCPPPSNPDDPKADYQASRHFVSSGDVDALLRLTRLFHGFDIKTEHAVAHRHRSAANTVFEHKNLILLGNLRTFEFLAELLSKHFAFQIEHTKIINSAPEEEKEKELDLTDNFRAPGSVNGILARTYDQKLQSWITILASNSGRFFETMGYYLTNDKKAAEVLQWFDCEQGSLPPTTFEAIVRVAVNKGEDNPRGESEYKAECLVKRPPRPKAGREPRTWSSMSLVPITPLE